MTYTISEQNTVQVLEVNSLLNEYDNKKILLDVQSRIEQGLTNFVVDLSNLDFLNSVGLNFLISVMTKSRKSGGELAVVNASSQVIKLLEITRLKPLFTIKSSVKEALSAIAK